MKPTELTKPYRHCRRWQHFRRRLRFKVFCRDKFTCQYCGRSVKDGIELTLDHIQPLSLGGTWEPSNLLTACEECNKGKASDLLKEIETEIIQRPDVPFTGWALFGCKWLDVGLSLAEGVI